MTSKKRKRAVWVVELYDKCLRVPRWVAVSADVTSAGAKMDASRYAGPKRIRKYEAVDAD